MTLHSGNRFLGAFATERLDLNIITLVRKRYPYPRVPATIITALRVVLAVVVIRMNPNYPTRYVSLWIYQQDGESFIRCTSISILIIIVIVITPKERFHRKTQTVEQSTRSQQSSKEASTQVAKTGVYYLEDESPDLNDTILHARKYFSSNENDKLRLENVRDRILLPTHLYLSISIHLLSIVYLLIH